MKCPICYFEDTKVIDSRSASDGLCIRRRRECLKCGFRFSTYEEIEILDLVIVKKDGRHELYNREKIVKGLKRALEKRPVDKEKFQRLVHAIERDVQKIRKNKIASEKIGEIIMRHLKRTDQVAYIRYASVYESFKDAKQFRNELNKLIKKKKIIKKN
ncbi:MAG: transcriptional regulator NrdR [Candidatus Pacebacteria bacterium]|nr:transcriptional regulator NrdR [Candidatus Paceibacterota bacterium]